jgi:5-formyltetrahydrofolate cyclo-ligase
MDKQALRERIWARLERRGVGRFPLPLRDRIPNFAGAERVAARVAALPEWKAARRLKCNPDAPQRALRLRALQEGKHVFMAVPRLRSERCFLHLDPARLKGRLAQAATIAGAFRLGEPVGPDGLGRIDLVVVGSVAVDRRGARVGKGGGYSDLEFALARELGHVDEKTPVVTTVHPLQVVTAAIPMTRHDVPIDVIATPDGVLRPRRRFPKPRGIFWDELSPAQLAGMPVLARLAELRPASGSTRAGGGGASAAARRESVSGGPRREGRRPGARRLGAARNRRVRPASGVPRREA